MDRIERLPWQIFPRFCKSSKTAVDKYPHPRRPSRQMLCRHQKQSGVPPLPRGTLLRPHPSPVPAQYLGLVLRAIHAWHINQRLFAIQGLFSLRLHAHPEFLKLFHPTFNGLLEIVLLRGSGCQESHPVFCQLRIKASIVFNTTSATLARNGLCSPIFPPKRAARRMIIRQT